MTALQVLVDGAPMPAEEARAFWKRFSDWMESRQGDLGGFARSEGLASVHPEMHPAGPVLVASRSAGQKPYGVAPKRDTGADRAGGARKSRGAGAGASAGAGSGARAGTGAKASPPGRRKGKK